MGKLFQTNSKRKHSRPSLKPAFYRGKAKLVARSRQQAVSRSTCLNTQDSSDDEFVSGSLRKVRSRPAVQPLLSVGKTPKSKGKDRDDCDFGEKVSLINLQEKQPGWPRQVLSWRQPAVLATRPTQNLNTTALVNLLASWQYQYTGLLLYPAICSSHSVSTADKGLAQGITSLQLASLPFDRLVVDGLIFIWASKECVVEVLCCMKHWGFHYVENLTWVLTGANGQPVLSDAAYFNQTHLTLLIGRKGGRDLELRHQRNADVIVSPALQPGEMPDSVYETIETLLPAAAKHKESGRPRLLELSWGQGVARPGWDLIAVTNHIEMHTRTLYHTGSQI